MTPDLTAGAFSQVTLVAVSVKTAFCPSCFGTMVRCIFKFSIAVKVGGIGLAKTVCVVCFTDDLVIPNYMKVYSIHRTYTEDFLRFEVTEEESEAWRKWRDAQASVIYPETPDGIQRVRLIEDHWTPVRGGMVKETTRVYVKTVPSALQEPLVEDVDFPEYSPKFKEAFKASVMSYTIKELFMEEAAVSANIAGIFNLVFKRCFGRLIRERRRGECCSNPIGKVHAFGFSALCLLWCRFFQLTFAMCFCDFSLSHSPRNPAPVQLQVRCDTVYLRYCAKRHPFVLTFAFA